MNNTISTPSISSSAMLSELVISQWSARKLDKTASRDITAKNYAEDGIANVNKKLLDCEQLKAIQKIVGATRNTHYSMTMPWSDSGLRLLTTKNYFSHQKEITGMTQEFMRLVDAFLSDYEWEINKTQAKLGMMFDRSEYPTTEQIRRKFRINLSYIPLPDVGDFRIDVGNEANEQLRSHYESYYQTKLTESMNDLWVRLHKVCKNMSERLNYKDHERSGTKMFTNTIVSNVLDVVELMKTCNLTDDPEMDRVARKLENNLHMVEPQDLRDDEKLREVTKKNIDEVLASLPSLDI
jgi:hypothetical protein